MLATLLALTAVSYTFPADKPLTYDVNVAFDGYIPVFGGQEGQVDVTLSYVVQGEEPAEDGNPSASGDITSFEMEFNGAKLPFQLEGVKQYFPKTTVVYNPNGSILRTDAPDLQLPVKLPGLDVKRFPDITYLPVEFPAAGIELGKKWTYSKAFGDSLVEYTVTPTSIDDSRVEMDVAMSQTYNSLEDSSRNPTLVEADADYSLTTKVVGSGKASFDRALGVVDKFQVVADATSDVTVLETQAKHQRTLKTSLVVKLRQGDGKQQ